MFRPERRPTPDIVRCDADELLDRSWVGLDLGSEQVAPLVLASVRDEVAEVGFADFAHADARDSI
jgi:hypothetical protein